MNPEEELELCKLLPHHKWEVGDKLTFPIRDVSKREIWVEMTVVYDYLERIDAVYTGHRKFHTIFKGGHNLIWLPHPHQIMAMKEWPDEYSLKRFNNKNSWCILDTKIGSISFVALTARLACLRAIAPFLKERE